HTDYVAWYEAEIGDPTGKKYNIQRQALSKALTEAGYVKGENRTGRTYFEGVILKTPEPPDAGPDVPLRNTTGLSEGLGEATLRQTVKGFGVKGMSHPAV